MTQSPKQAESMKSDRGHIGRRELFRCSTVLALPALLADGMVASGATDQQTAADGFGAAEELYNRIGVRPIINARGTFTIISGSLMLPEVREAMALAAQAHVHLDELADAVGARLAELTKAEWGMVSSGCAAALLHATSACVAGGNPDLHVRIPNLEGFPKDEVIIPSYSRNVYDASVRAVGVRVIEVNTREELEAAIGPRTAMIYILAGRQSNEGPLSLPEIAKIAKPMGVPVLVDAAAEILTVPNVHLEQGADLVGYSGGKCIRGPQSAGLLLGRKDLVKAAWVHSAPHHGAGRSMKVGKEEAIGMLMAVEMWMKRDHEAEWKKWLSWLDHIADRLSSIDGVTIAIRETTTLSNRTPALLVQWDRSKVPISGSVASDLLLNTEPRIATSGRRRGGDGEGISITAYMMSPGDEKVVANKLAKLLADPSRAENRVGMKPPAADLTGRWEVQIQYAAGSSTHTVHLSQDGNQVAGSHQGDFVWRNITGSIDGDSVNLSSSLSEQRGDSVNYRFTGTIADDRLSGSLDMGEYLTAEWSAKRYQRRRRRRG
jgi:L-seryl-tRNA(Ser) seleniumtransferase